MNRYLLLMFLSSWSHVVPLSLQCETGIAYTDHVLSVARSSLANADVAHLNTYTAEDVNACMNDCCTEKYGKCTVASFKKNASEENCMHFNCRPINKCKYLSSNLTDSFSFSSSLIQPLVPSSHSSKNHSSLTSTTAPSKEPVVDNSATIEQEHGVTKEAIAPFSEEQFALKNDNTTIKPRKGVEDSLLDSSFENSTRSGIKPRKGVSLDDDMILNNVTSKVKPRKGVGPYQPQPVFSHTVQELPVYTESSFTQSKHISSSSLVKSYKDISNDLVSALEKVFEDDTSEGDLKPSTWSTEESSFKNIESTSTIIPSVVQTSSDQSVIQTSSFTSLRMSYDPSIAPTSSVASAQRGSDVSVQTSVVTPVVQASTISYQTPSPMTSSELLSSFTTGYVTSSSVQTPNLHSTVQSTGSFNSTPMPSKSSSTILEHSKLLFNEISAEESSEFESRSDTRIAEESESERKYKSSMHLVLSLIFGLLVLFAVMGVVAKRVYDSWMRRHYRRMDFLIDGLYNGYG